MLRFLKRFYFSLFKKQEKTETPNFVPIVKEDFPLHQHQWELVLKTYAHPRYDLTSNSVNEIKEPVLSQMVLGVTTLLWQCSCGETKKEEVLGTDENLLGDLVEKAKVLGPQYIQGNDGSSYALTKMLNRPAEGTIQVR